MEEDENQAPLPVQPPARKNRRKRSIIIFVVVSLVNVGLLALLWSQLLTPAPSTTSGQTTSVDPLIGHPAPAFTLAALNMPSGHAKLFSLNELKGKAIVINVWASWCVPCNQEAPMLQATWKQMQVKDKDSNVVFLGIDFQDSSKDALTFMNKYGIGYPNVLDASGSVSIDYGVTGVPETIFINSKGTVVSTVRQELTAQALQSNLKLITS
ncbi:MAG TPA: TlpA disulfide reductase family protein [Ktedonobacteraceae bacterium]|nr:TlpA disulfide reductase family protein [Ktedonobacteraceae bacterium]